MEKRITIIFYASVLLLLSIALLSYRSLQSLTTFSEQAQSSTEKLFLAESLMSDLKDAETGQRGYLFTRDSRYLEPYYGKFAVVNIKLDSLSKKVYANNLPMQRLFDTLRSAVSYRFLIMEEVTDRFRKNNLQSNDTILELMKQGKIQMNNARDLTSKIQNFEKAELEQGLPQSRKLFELMPIYVLLSTIVALFFIAIAFVLINKQIKQLEQYRTDLEQKVEELNQSNKELENFAFIASHDLQEPLRKTMTFADRLQKKYGSEMNEDVQFLTARITDSVARMRQLVDDLLAFSRFFQKDFLQKQPVSLQKTLEQVLDEFAEPLRECHATFDIAPNLPTISAVPSQMMQLFSNLLSNSIKFGQADIPLHIDIQYNIAKVPASLQGSLRTGASKASFINDYHKISFSDNGIGFDNVYTDKIFKLFQRLHNREQYQGSGLGLAICQKIVAYHNGFIEAEGTPLKGATFTIYLPINL